MVNRHLPVMMGTLGRYVEIRQAVFLLVDSTIIALVFFSEVAATAAIASLHSLSETRLDASQLVVQKWVAN
jgi:hypothetical protein